MPFLKFCPKPKRALRISPPYLAEPVQKAYQRVFASMELLKIALTFCPSESNNYPANSQYLPVKITLDATFYKLRLKCLVNMCLHNTLDAHSSSCFMVQKNRKKARKPFASFDMSQVYFPQPYKRLSPVSKKQSYILFLFFFGNRCRDSLKHSVYTLVIAGKGIRTGNHHSFCLTA